MSTYEVRSLAYQYATQNHIENKFNNTTKLAGCDWIYGFLKRHPRLSLRTPENTSLARASGFNRASVNTFFNLLGSLIDKYAFPPSRIYNCDETGITTVPNKPTKLFSLKGKKQVGCLTSAERGTTVTAEICFGAAGHYVPPLLVIPRVRKNPIYEIGLPAETVVTYHNSGWMQSDIFSDIWFPHFLRHTRPSEDSPVLLILDGHATHVKNLKVIESARENHVVILSILLHTSHRLQPLDVSFMFPLSNYYSQEVKIWQRNKPNKKVDLADVGQIFSRAYVKAATLSNAQNGFKATGMYPFNPNKFPDVLFAPSELTERGNPNNTKAIAPTTPDHQTPTWSDQKQNTLSIKSKHSDVNKDNEYLYYSGSQMLVSPKNIIPIPKVATNQTRNKGPRRKSKTAVITSSPYLAELKELKRCQEKNIKPKQIKQIKRQLVDVDTLQKKKKMKTKLVESSDTEECNEFDESNICEDESDNSDFCGQSDDEDLDSEDIFNVINTQTMANHYVLVKLEDKKSKIFKNYVGQVVDVNPKREK